MRKKIYFALCCVLAASLIFVAGNVSAADNVIKWKMQVTHPFGNAGANVAFAWAAVMDKMTNGRLKVEIFPPNAMCQTSQMLQFLEKDVFQAGITYGGFYTGTIPETDLEIGLPLGHQTWDEVWDAMWNRGLGDVIQEAYSEHGLKWYPCAADNFYNFNTNFPVNKLEDLKGKKIRAVGVYGKYVQALGASPTTVHPAEMYMALKLGTIDGAIYGATGLQDVKLAEVIKYYTLPTAAQITLSLIINKKALAALPADIRNIVEIGSRYVVSDLSNQYITHCKNSMNKSLASGQTKISWLSEQELKKMRVLVVPIWDELAAKSPRMKKGVDILKKQMNDLGRPM
jgi:TRAP-type C4-dicarboxylate transport system substrate-binding protein